MYEAIDLAGGYHQAVTIDLLLASIKLAESIAKPPAVPNTNRA